MTQKQIDEVVKDALRFYHIDGATFGGAIREALQKQLKPKRRKKGQQP